MRFSQHRWEKVSCAMTKDRISLYFLAESTRTPLLAFGSTTLQLVVCVLVAERQCNANAGDSGTNDAKVV